MRRTTVLRAWGAALVAATAVGSQVAGAPSASAYNRTGCKWHSTTMVWGDPSNTSYISPTQSAASSWTATSTPLTMSEYNGSPVGGVSVQAYNYGTSQGDGYSSWNCSNGVSAAGTARYNTYYSDGYSSTGRKQLMVHEFGHLWGLAHAGSSTCSGQPIMYGNSDRYYRCGHSTPQSDDVNGANAIY